MAFCLYICLYCGAVPMKPEEGIRSSGIAITVFHHYMDAGAKPLSSPRAAGALHHRACSPGPFPPVSLFEPLKKLK